VTRVGPTLCVLHTHLRTMDLQGGKLYRLRAVIGELNEGKRELDDTE
jgi:hypothetical protein